MALRSTDTATVACETALLSSRCWAQNDCVMKNSTTVKPKMMAPDSKLVTAAVIAAGATNITAVSTFNPREFSPRNFSGGSGGELGG